jgi:hypothetical protein
MRVRITKEITKTDLAFIRDLASKIAEKHAHARDSALANDIAEAIEVCLVAKLGKGT